MNNNVDILLEEIKFIDFQFVRKKEIEELIIEKITTLGIDNRTRKFSIVRLVSSVAAVALLFISIGGFFLGNHTIESQQEIVTCSLPDNSIVTLRPNSMVKYNGLMWFFGRNVYLEGEAVFSVEKGERFSVVTNNGIVRVLGTQFMVNSVQNEMLVECYEGSVGVFVSDATMTLEKNQKLFYDGKDIFKNNILDDYIEFDAIVLDELFGMLKDIYRVRIENYSQFSNLRFSGIVATKDIEEALIVICSSCNIDYSIDSENRVVTIF